MNPRFDTHLLFPIKNCRRFFSPFFFFLLFVSYFFVVFVVLLFRHGDAGLLSREKCTAKKEIETDYIVNIVILKYFLFSDYFSYFILFFLFVHTQHRESKQIVQRSYRVETLIN